MSSYPVLPLDDDDLTLTPETLKFLKKALGKDLTDDEITNILLETRTSYVAMRLKNIISLTLLKCIVSKYKRFCDSWLDDHCSK